LFPYLLKERVICSKLSYLRFKKKERKKERKKQGEINSPHHNCQLLAVIDGNLFVALWLQAFAQKCTVDSFHYFAIYKSIVFVTKPLNMTLLYSCLQHLNHLLMHSQLFYKTIAICFNATHTFVKHQLAIYCVIYNIMP